MGLETQFLYIDDLNVDNPASTDGLNQADNHLRGIKNVLTNQFPDLGSAVVTATAAEINDVANKLTSFNGRTGPAILPAAGDYDINDLGDVDTTGLADGDSLVYNSTSGNFEVAQQGIAQASLTAQNYSGIGATDVKYELTASVYASTGLTVDIGNNRITNDTGRTILVIARAAYSWDGNSDPTNLDITLQRDGIAVGATLEHSQDNNSRDSHVTIERVMSLTDGQYVELFMQRGKNNNENIDVKSGGTLTVQIVPGA